MSRWRPRTKKRPGPRPLDGRIPRRGLGPSLRLPGRQPSPRDAVPWTALRVPHRVATACAGAAPSPSAWRARHWYVDTLVRCDVSLATSLSPLPSVATRVMVGERALQRVALHLHSIYRHLPQTLDVPSDRTADPIALRQRQSYTCATAEPAKPVTSHRPNSHPR